MDGKRVEACSAAAREPYSGGGVGDAHRALPSWWSERDVDYRGRMFEPVVAALMAVTPWVEVVRPGMYAACSGVAGAVGGVAAVELQDTVVELRVRLRSGGRRQPVRRRAWPARPERAASSCPPGGAASFLASYPVAVLGRPGLAELLPQLGIPHRSGSSALSTGHVTERFGAQEVAAHRLARGLAARPPHPGRPQQDLTVVAEFDPAAETADQVIFAAKALARGGFADSERRGPDFVQLRDRGDPARRAAS